MVEHKEIVLKAKDILENFLVLISLSKDYQLRLALNQRANQTFYTLSVMDEPYIMRVSLKDSGKITVMLDKKRFKSGIYTNCKLKNYEVTTSFGLGNDAYWHIISDKVEVVNDVISVINKKIK